MEISEFLDVISTDSPAGPNLRLVAGDLTLNKIGDFRRTEDPETSAGGESKAADWGGVRRECEACLLKKSKDLEVAAFLTEALCYLEGWAGLSSGLQLIKGLLDGFWEHVHPGWDDGEIIAPIRARPISWIGSARDFLQAVKKIPITAALGQQPFSYFDYEQSKRVDRASMSTDRTGYEELIESGLITGEQWNSALNTTPTEHLASVKTAVEGCAAFVQELYTVCEEKFGDDAPYLQDLGNVLDDCLTILAAQPVDGSDYSGEDAGTDTYEGDEMTTDSSVPTPVNGGQQRNQKAAGPIASREQAYRRLKEASEYLRRTEPHSPVPVLIDRAIAWGHMPFEELFKDVVKDRSTQDQVLEMLGVPDES